MTKAANQSSSPAGGHPPALPHGGRLLRYRDLLQLLPVTRRTIERWIQSGHFPPGRILGPQIRVWTPDEIAEWQNSALSPEQKNVA